MLLDIVADPIFRSDKSPGIAVLGQRRVAIDFLQCAVQPRDGVGYGRRIKRDFGKLVARDSKVAEHRVGKDFGEIVRTGARRACSRKRANVDLIGFGEAQQERAGDGALIALEVVQIGWADREAGCHVGLRQPTVAAETAQAGSKEKL